MEDIRMKWYIVSLFSLWTLTAGAQTDQAAVKNSLDLQYSTTSVSSQPTEVTMKDSMADKEVVADSLITDASTAYERHTHKYKNFWYKLVPNQFTTQYAGSIGVVSFGAGWHYGKHKNWETDLLLGFVPKYHSEETKVTFTVKERYVPWHLNTGRHWMVEPLTTGLFFSSIFGEDFWNNEPSRYPDRYYGFSTRVRANIFLGQRLTYRIPSKKRHFFRSISAYYELSTCDMYIISAIPNKNVRLSDILSLAAGIRLNVF